MTKKEKEEKCCLKLFCLICLTNLSKLLKEIMPLIVDPSLQDCPFCQGHNIKNNLQ